VSEKTYQRIKFKLGRLSALICIFLFCVNQANSQRIGVGSSIDYSFITDEHPKLLPQIIDEGSFSSNIFSVGSDFNYIHDIGKYYIKLGASYSTTNLNLYGHEALPFNIGLDSVVFGNVRHNTEIDANIFSLRGGFGFNLEYLEADLGLSYRIPLNSSSESFSEILTPPQVLFDNGLKKETIEKKNSGSINSFASLYLSIAKTFPVGNRLALRPDLTFMMSPTVGLQAMGSLKGVTQFTLQAGISLEFDLKDRPQSSDEFDSKPEADKDITPNIPAPAPSPPVQFEYAVDYSIRNAEHISARRFGNRKKGEGLIFLTPGNSQININTNILLTRSTIDSVVLVSNNKFRSPKLNLSDLANGSFHIDLKGVQYKVTPKISQVLFSVYIYYSGPTKSEVQTIDFKLVDLIEQLPDPLSVRYSVYNGEELNLSTALSHTILLLAKDEVQRISDKYPSTDFISLIPESKLYTLAENILAEYPDFKKIAIILD